MAKPRSRVADWLVYVLIRILVCVLQSLSLERSLAVARGLAWLAYRLDRRHRETACDNLRHAFPNRYSDAELNQLVYRVYQHFCALLIEILQMPRKLHVHTWRRYLELKNGRQLVDCLLSGRPLLLVTGHFGNWELGGYVLGALGFTTYAVARPLDNPFVDGFLRRFRERTGQRILDKKGSADPMQAILNNGGVIATLGDQDAGQRGLFVDFFGRPASTHKAIALLALQHNVPLLVIGVVKVGQPMRYQIVAEDLILPEEYERQPDAVRAMTQRFTTALERIVRTAPEQYFWLHRRWKHQPAQRKSAKNRGEAQDHKAA